MHDQQGRARVYRKNDDGRQPKAEEYQSVDMLGTKKLRGREKIEVYNDLVGEEVRRWKAASQHSRFLATPRVPGITAGIVILANKNISVSSNIGILQRAVRTLQ
jgi:hypothetical protein